MIETTTNTNQTVKMTVNININTFYFEAITSNFAVEWESRMSDYEPDYVYMIPVGYKSQEVFWEDFVKTPARVRGAFITDQDQKDRIDFRVTGPNNHQVYHNQTNECVFEFYVQHPGRYMITFSNPFVNSEVKVTFTMSTGQNAILKKEDLTFSDLKLESLFSFLRKFDVEYKMSRNSHTERYKSK